MPAMNALPPLELDVRPLLATGRGPLPSILATVSRLEPGQAFRLIAPLEPKPLYDVLGRRGLHPDARQRSDGAWEILFRPEPATEPAEAAEAAEAADAADPAQAVDDSDIADGIIGTDDAGTTTSLDK